MSLTIDQEKTAKKLLEEYKTSTLYSDDIELDKNRTGIINDIRRNLTDFFGWEKNIRSFQDRE